MHEVNPQARAAGQWVPNDAMRFHMERVQRAVHEAYVCGCNNEMAECIVALRDVELQVTRIYDVAALEVATARSLTLQSARQQSELTERTRRMAQEEMVIKGQRDVARNEERSAAMQVQGLYAVTQADAGQASRMAAEANARVTALMDENSNWLLDCALRTTRWSSANRRQPAKSKCCSRHLRPSQSLAQ
jgi:hypothetical protein